MPQPTGYPRGIWRKGQSTSGQNLQFWVVLYHVAGMDMLRGQRKRGAKRCGDDLAIVEGEKRERDSKGE
ncbi:hypothetical protein QQF64_033185 [Cirrhinus molitorella]|uniref:Uncharacterized protein n=1 Tax=Cirrhinus molitorella TaxID=172907 RepID=A0ABR3MT69_9TELE